VGLHGYDVCQKRGRKIFTVALRSVDMVRTFINSCVKSFFLSFSPAMFNVRSIIPVDNPLIFFLSEETKLYRLGRHGPRNERALALTLVHIVVAGFERFNSPPRRDEI